MTDDDQGRPLADRLLDAQVEFVLAELTGPRLAENVARDVDDVLAVAATLTLADVVKADDIKPVLRRLVDQVGASPLVAALVGSLSDALYELAASEQYTLGEVVDREPVQALVAKVLGLHTMHDRALERMTESPLVATVASRFVAKIVSDFLAQNRQRAEKVPGVGSLLSLGTSAASKVKSVSDRHLDQFLGDAVGKGAQFTLRRTNRAISELIRDPQLLGAAMEFWDLHADEPISGLRGYLTQKDLRELALLVHALLVAVRDKEYVGQALDECVSVFFEQYGDRDLATLLADIGITRDDLVQDICRIAPPIIEAAKADGVLAGHIRSRLEPFYRSAAVTALLTS